jgi:hypothetical protein
VGSFSKAIFYGERLAWWEEGRSVVIPRDCARFGVYVEVKLSRYLRSEVRLTPRFEGSILLYEEQKGLVMYRKERSGRVCAKETGFNVC